MGFLDLAGAWDASLMFVLGGAVGVSGLAFHFVQRRAPRLDERFHLGALRRVDAPVVLGSLYLFTLIGLVTKLISDLCYVWVDSRVKFDR